MKLYKIMRMDKVLTTEPHVVIDISTSQQEMCAKAQVLSDKQSRFYYYVDEVS